MWAVPVNGSRWCSQSDVNGIGPTTTISSKPSGESNTVNRPAMSTL